MRLSDLQNKDGVDVVSGEKIGNVVDAEISKETGNILKVIVYDRRGFIGMIRGKEEVLISWQQIKKIGSDVILVSRNL